METMKRLLWKEANQAWPWYLFGMLAAVAALPWVLAGHMSGWQEQVRDYPWMLVTLAMTVRGALLAAERNRQSYAVTHFSIHPERMPALAFGINLLSVLLLGLIVANAVAHYRDPMIMAPVALYFTTAFVIGYVVTAITQLAYLGIIAGIFYWITSSIIWLIRNQPIEFDNANRTAIMIVYILAGSLLAVLFLFLTARLPLLLRRCGMALLVLFGIGGSQVFPHLLFYYFGDNVPGLFIIGSSLVGILLAFIFLPLSTRLPIGYRLGGMVLFVVLGIAGPLIIYAASDHANLYYQITNQRLATSDGARVVDFIQENTPQQEYCLRFTDYHRQQVVRQQVTVPYLLLGFDSPNSAVMVGQRRHENRMSVVRWRLAENRLDTLFTFPIRHGALETGLTNAPLRPISLRPDGAYAALQFSSLLGDTATDLWILDLRRKQAHLVYTGQEGLSLSWRGDCLILGSTRPIQIVLTTWAISPFPITRREE